MNEHENATAIQAQPETRPDAPAQWQDREDIAALANRLQTMLPGAKLKREEALLLAQYSAAMDANPFRGEIYAFTQHGKLVLVEGYKLLVRWAKRQEPYSEHYEPMDHDAEIDAGDIAYRCYILRESARPLMQDLVAAGAPWHDAFKFAAAAATGVVTKADRWSTKNNTEIDPPTGWTWDEVARKRALKNALNRAYGAPSPLEIARETWMVDDTETTPEDWELVAENIAPGAGPDERARVAKMIHDQREAGERVHNPDTAIPTGRQNRSKHQLFKGETTEDATAPHQAEQHQTRQRRLELLNGGFPEGAITEL